MTANTKNLKKVKSANKKARRKRLRNKILIAVFSGLFLPLIFLYLYVAYYYQNRFYYNTFINGVNTSNMTLEEAQDTIDSEVKAYLLALDERNGISETISGKSIDLHTVFERSLSDLIKEQNTYSWPAAIIKPHKFDIKTMLEYDESLLKQEFTGLKCFQSENNIEPVNATISGYGENGYGIESEKPGARVIEDKLYKAIQDAVITLKPSIVLDDVDCYEKPEITSDYPPLLKAQEEMNKIAGARITYQFGDKTEVLDGNKISKWITVDKDYQVHFEPGDGIKEFVDYIGKTYNTFGKVRTFQTTYGDVIKVSGGDYGWWLNRPKEVEELTELVKNGEQINREPVYFQKAQQYGDDDIGNTYVEINLTAQHLFYYKEGKLVLESDFVSGNVSKGLGTPVGTYPIQYKDLDATLVGEDYETPVKYWMPFNKNVGMHDASWRNKFGKDIYLKNGSHGCINMPPDAAKKLYQNIQKGVAVVVYELPGTENYVIKNNSTKDNNKKVDGNTAGSNKSADITTDNIGDSSKENTNSEESSPIN